MNKLFASALALTIGATGAWADNHDTNDTAENQDAMTTSNDTQMADSGIMCARFSVWTIGWRTLA